MKRLMTLLTVALTCLSLFAPMTAEAGKRLGGGASFGKQRDLPQQQSAQRAAEPAPAKPAAAPAASTGNKWLGPLAGLAIGAGLASLLAGTGLGGAMGMLLLALLAGAVVLFLIARFKSAPRPAMQYAGAGAPYQPAPVPASPAALSGGLANSVSASFAASIPEDFPVDKFLRNAKASFIRLQAANDRKDLNDIRAYTTPEVFAEISLQMQERGDAPQHTEVLAIDAQLLEVAIEGDISIASVRFVGELRDGNSAPEAVDEIWHVQKDLRDDKSVWLIAGIQQTRLQ